MSKELLSTEDKEHALTHAQIAVNNDTTNFTLYVDLGMAHFHADQFDEAMAAFERAIELNPDAAQAYNGIGRIHYHTGPSEKAIEAYQRAIALDPQYIAAYYGLGILYLAQIGDFDAALEVFQQGLKHNPNEAFLITSLGNTYARMGRIDESMASLEEAIRLDPNSGYAYGLLSIIYLHQKRYDDMIASCQREIEIEDSNDARRLLGYVYDHLGQHDEAITQLEQSVALNPEDYEARGALANVYGTVGRQQDANKQYGIAREMAMQDNEYGQACFAAVSGNVEQTLTLLEVGLAEGQLQPGWARIDPEFAFMNDDPRFKALIEK